MNNICIDHDRNVVTVEGPFGGEWPVATTVLPDLLVAVLNTAHHGGESVCVEEKRGDTYTGQDRRWPSIRHR